MEIITELSTESARTSFLRINQQGCQQKGLWGRKGSAGGNLIAQFALLDHQARTWRSTQETHARSSAEFRGKQAKRIEHEPSETQKAVASVSFSRWTGSSFSPRWFLPNPEKRAWRMTTTMTMTTKKTKMEARTKLSGSGPGSADRREDKWPPRWWGKTEEEGELQNVQQPIALEERGGRARACGARNTCTCCWWWFLWGAVPSAAGAVLGLWSYPGGGETKRLINRKEGRTSGSVWTQEIN